MNVPKIVLTGGSLSGKTNLIKDLQKQYQNRCIFIPEAATYIIEGGYKYLKQEYPPEVWGVQMQQAIMIAQKGVEDSFSLGAPFSRFKGIICDRGLLDGYGYYGKNRQEYIDLLERTTGTQETELYSRYDKVIMLQSIANLGTDYYNLFAANNPSRMHSAEETLEAEARIREIYSRHPNFTEIPIQDSYTNLRQVVEKELLEYLGKEIEYKFLVNRLPNVPLTKLNIEQIYVNKDPEIRFRKITEDSGLENVLLGIKSRNGSIEFETEVPHFWYEVMGQNLDPVVKTRYVDKNGVVFDKYPDFVIAEIEVSNQSINKDWLLNWFQETYQIEAKDVTDDPKYKAISQWELVNNGD